MERVGVEMKRGRVSEKGHNSSPSGSSPGDTCQEPQGDLKDAGEAGIWAGFLG